MYRGFNLKLNKSTYCNFEKDYYFEKGSEIQEKHKSEIKKKIERYIKNKKVLSGDYIMDNWFPVEDKYDIFLSHSHNDLNLAYYIAGILKEECGLEVFIDSNIWLNCNDLLKTIDYEYCKTGTNKYSYECRNYSTAHIHMMLMASLNRMIDNTECLFFLNTPQSVSTESIENSETYSPWIFSEIETSRIIRKKIPERRKNNVRKVFSNLNENMDMLIGYRTDLDHLTKMTNSDFCNWVNACKLKMKEKSLDELYEMKPHQK